MTKAGKIVWVVCTAMFMEITHLLLAIRVPAESYDYWSSILLWGGNCAYCFVCGLIVGRSWAYWLWAPLGNAGVFLAVAWFNKVPFDDQSHMFWFAGLYLAVTAVGMLISGAIVNHNIEDQKKYYAPGQEEFELYELNAKGAPGFKQSPQAAIEHLKESARLGYPKAILELNRLRSQNAPKPAPKPVPQKTKEELITEAKEVAKKFLDDVPPEMAQVYIDDADEKIRNGTADAGTYSSIALIYAGAIPSVQKNIKKSLEYVYGLIRKDPDEGIKLFYNVMEHDKSAMTVTGVDPHEDEIRKTIGLITAAEMMRNGEIGTSSGEDPNTNPQLKEIMDNIPTMKAMLKDF